MKALRSLRSLAASPIFSANPRRSHLLLRRLFSAEPHPDDPSPSPDFDSADFTLPSPASTPSPNFDSADFTLPAPAPSPPPSQPTWDKTYREKADRALFGNKKVRSVEEDEEKGRRLARALLQVALEPPDEDEDEESPVKVEDQRSLTVGIIGAPNAGKSSLTNLMVGTKVAAVSRKTNTTTHEVLGVMTKGNTQICFFDTPGLMLGHHGYPYRTDVKVRVESAWSSLDLYDLIIVIFDVHRQLSIPDTRVMKLIKHLGEQVRPEQKRVLCMNKIDLVEDKKDLLTIAKEFEDLPGYERYFMISGLKGSGVKDLVQYLVDHAIKRPWDEEPTVMSEEIMKNISLEVVREKMLNYIHQEIPYAIEHRLMDWKELRNGSLRIEQHFITSKPSQRQILVGKNGSKIGRIGMEANEELRSIFKREVHLILQVRLSKRKGA